MICSTAELGLGDDHDGIIVLPADAGEPGDDAFAVLGLRDEVIEFEINPDRAYALSLRGVAREAALAFGAPYTDPAERDVPAADDDGYPVVVDDPPGCPVFVARTVTGFDPAAPTPGLDGAPPDPGRHAADLAGRRRHQLRDARARPADPRLRRRQARRAPIRVRRATAGERLTTLDGVRPRRSPTEDLVVTDDSGIIGLGGVMGGETTEMSATTTRVLVEAAHWDADVDVPHRQAAQAHLRGRQAQRARRRPGDHARPRPTGWSSCSSPTAAAPPSPASPWSARPPAPRVDHDGLRPARPGHRHRRSTRTPRWPTSRRSAAPSTRRRRRAATPSCRPGART